ncbi:neuritin-like protein [Eudromia elegans]
MGGGGGCCWRLLGALGPLLLLLHPHPHPAAAQEAVSTAGQCDTIYKGFAGCLLSLGDSMGRAPRDGGPGAPQLDTVCRSWDEFHACASGVLSSCPKEAAAVWESLREESRKIQFQGNLHELCGARGSPAAEPNQETLRGSGRAARLGLPALLALLALLAPWL